MYFIAFSRSLATSTLSSHGYLLWAGQQPASSSEAKTCCLLPRKESFSLFFLQDENAETAAAFLLIPLASAEPSKAATGGQLASPSCFFAASQGRWLQLLWGFIATWRDGISSGTLESSGLGVSLASELLRGVRRTTAANVGLRHSLMFSLHSVERILLILLLKFSVDLLEVAVARVQHDRVHRIVWKSQTGVEGLNDGDQYPIGVSLSVDCRTVGSLLVAISNKYVDYLPWRQQFALNNMSHLWKSKYTLEPFRYYWN